MIDLDNTLNDRHGAVLAWIREFSASQRLPDDATDWFVDADGDGYSPRGRLFEDFCRRFDLDVEPSTLALDYQQRIRELLRANDGAEALLAMLRSLGERVAIVTNGATEQQHAKVDRLGFRSLVDAVCVSGEVGVAKPDPRIFEMAAAMADAPLHDSWMIGDSAALDIEAARAVGSRTVWLRRGREWPDTLAAPDRVIDSLTELTEFPWPPGK